MLPSRGPARGVRADATIGGAQWPTSASGHWHRPTLTIWHSFCLTAPSYSAGSLLGRVNQVVHGLRAAGVGKGDAVATVLPNGIELVELYLAALQAGWYLVPINHHLVGPEIAYIVDDSEAKVLVGHERFAAACIEAAASAGMPSEGLYAVGKIDGFRSFAEMRDPQPTAISRRSHSRRRHELHVGDDRPAEGRAALAARRLARRSRPRLSQECCFLFGVQPGDDNVHIIGSPLYHTAVMRFGGASMHLGHTVVLMDKWDPEGMLQLIERTR